MKVTLAIICLIFLFAVSGSRYQVQSPPSPGVRIAIPLFINNTFKQGLSEVLTGEVVDEFMLRSNLQIVSEKEAEFALKGKILGYTQQPPPQAATTTGEHRVTIEVKVTFYSLKKDRVLWEEKMSKTAVYSVLQVGSIQTEEEAIREISCRIGESILNLTLQRWGK